VLLLAAWPGVTRAFEFELPWWDLPASIDLTGKHVFEYHSDNLNGVLDDDGYYDLRNQFHLKLAVERFSLSVRLDTATFFHDPEPGQGRAPYLDRYGLEKLSAAYARERWSVQAGDFYATFGRGLVLRIHKTDALGEDTTLLGLKGQLDLPMLELVALAGLTNASSPDLYEKTVVDPYDLVTGLSVGTRVADLVKLGAHGVWYLYDPLELNDQRSSLPDHQVLAGARVEVPDLLEAASLYLEADWVGTLPRPVVAGQEVAWLHGYAVYFHGDLALSDWTLTLEAKSTRRLSVGTRTPAGADGQYNSSSLAYVRPPTLEPEDMEVTNNHDLSGARVELSYRPNNWDTLLFGSVAGFLAEDYGSAGQRSILNYRLGVEQDFLGTGRARVSVGIREEHPDYAYGDHQHLIYANAMLKIPLAERHSLDLHGFNWVMRKRVGEDVSEHLEGEWVLGYGWSPWLAASLIFGYDTEPTGSKSLAIFADQGGRTIRQAFLAGSLTVNLWSHAVLRVLGGQLRGGLKCIEGVCKNFPPFAGVRTDLTLRF
jgi:hypothetical protein